MREGKLKAETLEVASVQLAFTKLLIKKGILETAEEKARSSLTIRERILGSQHPYVAIALTGDCPDFFSL